MIPGSLSLIATTFEPSRRGKAIGIWSACSVIMSALGSIIGGLFAEAGLWRAVFFINVPIGLLSIAVLSSTVKATPYSKTWRSLDYVGAALSILGLACLNFALLEVTTRGWSDPVVITAIVISLALIADFLLLPPILMLFDKTSAKEKQHAQSVFTCTKLD